MMFCGSRVNAMSVDGGVLKNECFVDILNIIPHGVLLLVAIPVLIVLNKSSFGCMEVSAWVHFRGHSTRWLLTLLMILILAVELGEGLIADSLDPDSVNLHVILPSSLSIIGMIASITYYHNIEQWNVPKFLLMLMMYWTAMVILKSLKGVSLLLNHASHIHLRLWITWIGVIVYASLLLLEIYVLKKQRYAFYKKRVKLSPPDEMGISPYVHHHVNFLSKVTFWWVNDFLRKGFKRPLEQEDLGQIPWRDQAFVQYGKLSDSFFNEKFKAEQAGKKVSFHRAYFKAFWKMLALAGALRFIADTLAFIGPWSIEYIVEFAYKLKNNTGSHSNTMQNGVAENVTLRYNVNQSISDLNITGTQQDSGIGVYVTVVDFFSNGYVLCFCLFLATLLQHTLLQNHHYLCIREGIRLKIAVQALVYSKALKLSTAVITSGEMAMGQIINLMSSDANFMMNLFFFIHFIWSAPYQTILALVLMYYKLGWSAVVGGSVVILAGPINYFLGKVMSKMQKKTMQKADARVKKCNEAIQGIKVIKLLSWESHFMSNIISSRKEELKFIFHAACMRVFMSFISVCVPILGTMVAFLVHPYLEEEPFSVGTALSTLALFNIIQVPSTLFGMFIVTMVTARVSASRLLKFFLSLEVEKVELRTPRLIHQDTDLSLKSHHALEMSIFEMRNGGKVSKATDTKEEDQLSLSSMGSYYSRTPGHSRRGSHASLLDAQDSLGSLRGTMSCKHSSSALTVEGEGRRRHASGISSEDDDDAVNEICITIEPITVMEMTNGNFAWEKDKEPILRDINVVIPEGKLTLIVGQVGSGKSSLLAAALGEMITTSGRVEWKCGTTKALVSQKPWLLNATLKDNILFGQSFHWKRYARIIKACSLQQDIDILPSGDMTEIGEKGINLSGGQKQRVCIARALYSKANTFLMDDPLSSLDAHVGKHVFEEAILHRLLKRKRTVVLVTHQLQYISYAHHIIVMHEGQVKYQGKLADVKKIDPDLYESWRQALKDSKVSQHTDSGEGKESLPEIIDTADLSKSSPSKVAIPGDGAKTEGATARRISSQSHCHSLARLSNKLADFEEETISQAGKEGENEDQEVPEKGSQSPSGHENEKPEEAKGKLIKKEHRESGSVALRVYWSYVQACFVPLVTLTLLTFLLYNGLLIGCNVVLSLWSAASSQFLEQQALVQYNVTQVKDFDNLGYIQQYIILNVSGIGTALFAWAMLHLSGLMGSRHLHNNMLNSVLHMRLRFFDTNPTGRIMNRFSADLSQIDQKLPTILENLLRCLLLTLSGLVVNSLATPYFLLAAVPLMLLYYCMQVFYRATARELQRIDSITKSPVYSHFSETVNGLQTIRAYGVEKQFKIKALSTINDNTAPLLYLHTINRWLGIRLDYLGAFLVLVAGVSSLAACGSGSSSPAYVGLSITYALLISFYLNWIVRNSAETEMIMNAVERVYEYSHMETESSAKRQGSEAKYSSWPQNGKIEFRNVSIKYDENLDDVVKNVTFTFNSGEKIGICGRTGSGKSSLVLSIFRMIHVSQGHIFIDERDTSMIPLHELRSRLAIIPQDPVLFTGTIRYNLCPDGGISDQDIWSALETVQLKDTIAALPDKLDSHVSEGGENFSIGQKQLFCLARAFLRDNKILVLDEATASIDLETDNKLQSVIFSAFQDKTVITIAHRISTIMKYNKVMVMHEGTVKEFDSPQTLLRDSSSMFHALVHAVKSSS